MKPSVYISGARKLRRKVSKLARGARGKRKHLKAIGELMRWQSHREETLKIWEEEDLCRFDQGF